MNELRPKRATFMSGPKKTHQPGDWRDYVLAGALVLLFALAVWMFFLWIFHDDFKPSAVVPDPSLTPRAAEFKQ
jgi:hypothetical protein